MIEKKLSIYQIAVECRKFANKYVKYFQQKQANNDWFFVTGSTYPFIPAWLMPLVVLVLVFAMCAIIHLIDYAVKILLKKRQNKKITSK